MVAPNIKHYIISCDPYVYGATITRDKYLERDLIKFGGKKECVHIAIYDDIPNIDGVGYGKKCALNKSLEQGEGTEHLLKTAIRFICNLYPDSKAFSLKDTSHIKCKDGDTMSLGLLYIAKYGETWYQKKFGARAVRKEYVDEMLESINNCLTSTKMTKFSKFRTKYLRMTEIEESHLEDCKRIYKKNNCLRHFIIEFCNKYDCSFTRKWLPKLITDIRPVILENEEFIIKKSTVKKWKHPIVEIENVDTSSFEKKSKAFVMNVMKGGKTLNPHLTQPLLYKDV